MKDNFSTGSSGVDEASPLGPTGGRRVHVQNPWRNRRLEGPAENSVRAAQDQGGVHGGPCGRRQLEPCGHHPPLCGVPFGPHISQQVSPLGRIGGVSIDGIDQAGRKASFDLVLMPKDYTWALGSSTELALRGVPLSEAEASARMLSAEVREGLQHSPEVIAVGVASQEGELESERDRAERRAKSQAQLIAKSVSPLTGIWLLNLGRYNEECNTASAADTSWQRPVMLVGVRSQQPGVALAQALENAISGKSNVPDRVSRVSPWSEIAKGNQLDRSPVQIHGVHCPARLQ